MRLITGRPSEVVNAHDVGVVHQAQRACLFREARDGLGRAEQRRMDNLDGDGTFERFLDCAIHATAASGVDQFDDLVAAREKLPHEVIAAGAVGARLFGSARCAKATGFGPSATSSTSNHPSLSSLDPEWDATSGNSKQTIVLRFRATTSRFPCPL